MDGIPSGAHSTATQQFGIGKEDFRADGKRRDGASPRTVGTAPASPLPGADGREFCGAPLAPRVGADEYPGCVRHSMGSSGMLEFATANDAGIRGPVGDWHALKSNRDYTADGGMHGGAPSVVGSAGCALRARSEADLEAARWGLLAWEDPRERGAFKPFWIDDKMLVAVVVEPGDTVGTLARVTGMRVCGLRLLDGALALKVKRGRRVEQIRVLEGDSFDLERTALELRCPFDGFPPAATSRLCNLAAMMKPRKRPPSNR